MAIFQHYMDTLLAGITGIQPYLDDILNTGRTPEEHKYRLRRFVVAGLQLQKEKFIFAAPSVEFLGFNVDKDGVRPTQDKVKAIKEAPSSKSFSCFWGFSTFTTASCLIKLQCRSPCITYWTRQLPGG